MQVTAKERLHFRDAEGFWNTLVAEVLGKVSENVGILYAAW